MDFELSDEQRLIRRTARAFCDAEIAPHAAEWDRAEAIDPSILGKLASLGFLPAALPAEHGGHGLVHAARRGARPGGLERPLDRVGVERAVRQVGRPLGHAGSARAAAAGA